MKSLKIFPKILATTFFILSMLVIGIHVSIYFIFQGLCSFLRWGVSIFYVKVLEIMCNL